MRNRRRRIAACERSLRRLGTDHLDLYLLHWRGRIPLAETVAAFETLRSSGKSGAGSLQLRSQGYGRAARAPGRSPVRGEPGPLPLAMSRHRMGVVAVLPQAPHCRDGVLAARRGSVAEEPTARDDREPCGREAGNARSPAVLAQKGVVSIPKATDPAHVRDARDAAEIVVGAGIARGSTKHFLPPTGRPAAGHLIAPPARLPQGGKRGCMGQPAGSPRTDCARARAPTLR